MRFRAVRFRAVRFRAVRAALAAGLLGLAVAVGYDAWYRSTLIVRERERVRANMAPYAQALENAVARRVLRLQGLKTFVEAQPSPDELSRKFNTFAAGLRIAAPGIRALQLNKNGRIIATEPLADGPRLLGYNLLSDPRPEIVRDVRRAMGADSVVITGPIDLLQGGRGLLVRFKLDRVPAAFPDLVSMAVDLEPLLDEASRIAPMPRLRVALLDRERKPLRGSPIGFGDPATMSVSMMDGTWTLLGVPVDGWNRAVARELGPTRVASAVILLLVMCVSYLFFGRQARLEDAVDARTQDLERANQELRHEVAERERVEQQLLHSQKMEAVGTLAGGIAHDFNNLLTAMMGFAQLADQQASTLLQDDAPIALRNGMRDVRTELTEIMKAGERASMLTSQLLAFSRRQKVTPTEVDVNVAVHDIERMLQRLIGERLTLTTKTAAQALPVMVDGGQLAQVLVNLVINARDAMPDGGRVQVSTEPLDLAAFGDGAYLGVPAGAWVELTVQDSGTGMSPEVQARIFEPFYTTKAMGDGTGLGLSTVYGIVQQAGGRVLVDSTLGVGTTIRVLLPRLAARSVPVVATPTADRPGTELILVVEDEPGLRRLVAEILSRRGYRVRVAADGVDALEVLETDRELPSLVITDVMMPRLGGRGLAETMTARRILIPILFMSGYQAGEELPEDARHTFVPKPFTPDALIAKVRQLLEHERATV